jgi:uncharacterized protein (DUF433 family)/DNA-binding transcriptional MerR regulator
MAFPVPIASVLTGASPRQLAYWRKRTASSRPLLVPAAKRSGRFLYNWGDIVALRSIVYLRQEKSLHKIRRAVKTLRNLEASEWEHLSKYQLVSTAKTIIVRTPSGELLDLEDQPGTVLEEILMSDVLKPFQTKEGSSVPALDAPLPYLVVDPHVLGGYPVIAGSRVPFDIVAGLADDGVESAEIVQMFPSVDERGVPDASAFAAQVARVA